MKFCENLQNLRKGKKISQEQLAEMLGVTRQSVSKWESGASYPEMEKLTELCKIFHCSLDTLVNGNALEEAEKRNNNVFYSVMSSIELSIKKTIALLENMSVQEIIKFLITLFVIGMVVLACKIPFVILEDSINSIFYHSANAFSSFLGAVWSFLLNLAYGIFAIVIFLYIYKIKYLDRIEFTDKEEKIELEKEKIVQKEKPAVKTKKFVYREHSGVFDFLTTLMIYFIKFICGIILIWDLCALVTSMILFVFIVILALKGLILIGPILMGIGVIAFTIVVAVLLLNFIANRKSKPLITFVALFSSIALTCIGLALSLWYFANITYINGLPASYEKKQISNLYDMSKDLVVVNHYNIEYVEDETLTDKVRVELEYYHDNFTPKLTLENNKYLSYHLEEKYVSLYPKEIIDQIINDLKKKRLYTYDNLWNEKMIITTSKENISKIKMNTYHEYSYDDEFNDDDEYLED